MNTRVQPISEKHALKMAKTIHDTLGPEYCAYIVLPNVVLTLANARLYADGVFYSPSEKIRASWVQDLRLTLEALQSKFDLATIVSKDKNPQKKQYVSFDLLNPAGLKNSLGNYSFFNTKDKQRLLKRAKSLTVLELLKSILLQKAEFKSLNDEYLGHATSGIILGYPEKAILGSLDLWQKEGQSLSGRPISADIRGADYYVCPQPVYDYPRRLASDSDINKHERLWSQVLQSFYTSEFHQKLAKTPRFKKKMQELTEH